MPKFETLSALRGLNIISHNINDQVGAIIIAHHKLDDQICAIERVDIYRQSQNVYQLLCSGAGSEGG